MCEFESVEVYLPEVAKEFVTIVGLPATEALVKRFGGLGFYINFGTSFYKMIVETIGKELADKLTQYLQNCFVYVPKCDAALRVLRNKQFYKEFLQLTEEQGMSGRKAMLQLCPKFKLSDRHGWEIVYSFRRTSQAQQQALF
ncbi:Mor transcription activator family protein [Actinobacillus capsulatus]|uniref:Mor transcription activator family protein n=1 Tax=Actinobacillus capsulatus TaxID=717 RepID=UPI000375B710|nr:Mor transcription activator family protein [Actinobacillus capsulatus]